MIQKILNPQTCANCKICCNYSINSLWDIPGFTLKEYKQIITYYPQYKSISYCKNNLYYFKTIPTDNDKYLCPFLADNGCTLGNNKPFKCAIWPFYVVKYKNNIYLAQSDVCPNLQLISKQMLTNGLETTITKIKKIINQNPELIESYRPHFSLIIQLDI